MKEKTITGANIFYVSNFNIIGGIETFIYELARKYSDYDITIVYKTGDQDQLERLRKHVKVRQYQGQKIKAKKAFFNYHTDIIDHVEADEYIQIIHAMFKTQGIDPKLNPRIDRYLSVSNSAGAEWKELTGKDTTTCRSPLTITPEERQEPIILVSATRLTAEKGKDRMKKLAQDMDRAGINYMWFIFTNDRNRIENPSIYYMKPTLNIRPFIASIRGRGYGVQLSDCEGDCYFTRECSALGVPLIVTPVPSFKEQGLIEGKNCYFVPFDMKDTKIERIMRIPEVEPFQVQDQWEKILIKEKTNYKEEIRMNYKVKALKTYKELNVKDGDLGRIPEEGEEFTISGERLEVLLGENKYKRAFVELVEEKKIETATAEKREIKPKSSKHVKKRPIQK